MGVWAIRAAFRSREGEAAHRYLFNLLNLLGPSTPGLLCSGLKTLCFESGQHKEMWGQHREMWGRERAEGTGGLEALFTEGG